jgi:hypothetical protein
MYHLELRKFPHVVCRFNQSEAQLRALVVPWVRQEWVEEGERKWNVNEAGLTILEGPKLSMPELAMGKGWRNAQKRSEDVTERVLGAVQRDAGQAGRAGAAAGGGDSGTGVEEGEGRAAPSVQTGEVARDAGRGADGGRETDLLADSLALEVLALLDDGPVAPARVWRMAQERLAQRDGAASAADALALGERAVGSLLRRGLVALRSGGDAHERDGGVEAGEAISPERQETVLAAVETWAGGEGQRVAIARKG